MLISSTMRALYLAEEDFGQSIAPVECSQTVLFIGPMLMLSTLIICARIRLPLGIGTSLFTGALMCGILSNLPDDTLLE